MVVHVLRMSLSQRLKGTFPRASTETVRLGTIPLHDQALEADPCLLTGQGGVIGTGTGTGTGTEIDVDTGTETEKEIGIEKGIEKERESS